MVAHGRTEEEIAAELGCDSLRYLSLEGVYEAIRSTRETHCDACFSGDYPLDRTESANGKYALEELPVVKSSGPARHSLTPPCSRRVRRYPRLPPWI